MNKKIIYSVLIILFVIAIILTCVVGLNVSLNYAEGYTIKFTMKSTIELEDIEKIAKEVWNDENSLVQNVEFFNDSAQIKVKSDPAEKLQTLCDKLNEKYSSETKIEDLTVNHVPNIKIRNLVEPYIIPIGISTLLILAYFAVRFKSTKHMLGLIKWLAIVEGLLYCVYAIFRVPVFTLTMPIAVFAYILTVLIYVAVAQEKENKQ